MIKCNLGGQGVLNLGMVKIEVCAVFDKGQCNLPDTFYEIKIYCSHFIITIIS